MTTYKFPCGCEFDVIGPCTNKSGIPLLKVDPDYINGQMRYDCPATWKLISSGLTKGIFQLESNLGRHWSKEIKPESIEHLGAIGAVLRPSCISGDTPVTVRLKSVKGRPRLHDYFKVSMREVYERFNRCASRYKNEIVSLNEEEILLFNNSILNVTYNGIQDVFKPKFKTCIRSSVTSEKYYNLECTADHKLLTHDKGWIELRNLTIGDRIAVINGMKTVKYNSVNAEGEKYFRSTCFQNYIYSCIFCDWKEGSLDVNHLEGNRKTNNRPENLCFMCPNHHRLYTEGKISKDQAIDAREAFRLKNTVDVQWVEYIGCDHVGKKDVYDVGVSGCHHNFVAGNVIVHNCLNAFSDGKSMTEHYALRKNGLEEISCPHPILKDALDSTFSVMVYQEQCLLIAKTIAGFSMSDALDLQKAFSKKKADKMAEMKVKFLDGAKKVKAVPYELAEEIFGWIEASQRYSFCRAHAIAYGINGYISAFMKAHFPHYFFTSYLYYAKDKQDPLEEIKALVEEAKLFDVKVLPPDFRTLEEKFNTDGVNVYFGLSDVKGVGIKSVHKARETVSELGGTPDSWSWLYFLLYFSTRSTKSLIEPLISVGAFDWFGMSRKRMLFEYSQFQELKEKELEWASDQWDIQNWNELIDMLKAIAPTRKNGGGASNKNRSAKVSELIKLLENPPFALEDTPNWISATEKKLLGIAISCHATDSCNTNRADASCKDVLAGRKGILTLAVEIQDIKQHTTKKGDKMAFVTASDESCLIDNITVFPDAYKEISCLLSKGNTLLIQGEINKQSSFIVSNAWQI